MRWVCNVLGFSFIVFGLFRFMHVAFAWTSNFPRSFFPHSLSIRFVCSHYNVVYSLQLGVYLFTVLKDRQPDNLAKFLPGSSPRAVDNVEPSQLQRLEPRRGWFIAWGKYENVCALPTLCAALSPPYFPVAHAYLFIPVKCAFFTPFKCFFLVFLKTVFLVLKVGIRLVRPPFHLFHLRPSCCDAHKMYEGTWSC